MLYNGIEHIGIASSDTQRLSNWYCEVLGYSVAFDNGKQPPTFLLTGPGPAGGMLEILPAKQALQLAPVRDDAGIRHLAVSVDDFDAAYEALRSRQITFISEPASSHGNRVVFFADCDGNILHLICRQQPIGSISSQQGATSR